MSEAQQDDHYSDIEPRSRSDLTSENGDGVKRVLSVDNIQKKHSVRSIIR